MRQYVSRGQAGARVALLPSLLECALSHELVRQRWNQMLVESTTHHVHRYRCVERC